MRLIRVLHDGKYMAALEIGHCQYLYPLFGPLRVYCRTDKSIQASLLGTSFSVNTVMMANYCIETADYCTYVRMYISLAAGAR